MKKKLLLCIFFSFLLFMLISEGKAKAAIDGGDGSEDISTLPLITEQSVDINLRNHMIYFKFVPAYAGEMIISVGSSSDYNITIANSSGIEITSELYIHELTFSCQAEETYYLGVGRDDISGEGTYVPTLTVFSIPLSGGLPTVSSVTVTPDTASMIPGETKQLSASVAVAGGAATTVNWTSDDAKVTVTDGLVKVETDAAPGNYIITATSTVDDTKSDTATITVTRIISGYFKDNTGADTELSTITSVAYGTGEAIAKTGLTTSGYAKLSDGSYVPVTISWTFNSTYDGSAVGDKALKGIVSGTFPGGLTPTDRIGTVTVQADTRTINGYYKVNTGADTALTTLATVAFGTSEAAAKAGLTTSGYAKLSDGSYVPVTISWTFDSSYDGSAVGDKAVKGTVSGTFPGGQTPTDRTGTVTVQADTRTINGYYKVNTGADTALTTIATVAFGTSEAAAKAGLTTSGYAKLSDGSYVPVTINWTFDSSYDGNVVGDKAVKGTVSGTFPGGQTPTDRTGTVTVQADTRTINGYYKVNTGADTALTTLATVGFGTSEAAAKAGLTTSGYAKLSDGSYVPVTISWTFDSSYDGSVVGDKAVKGTVSGTFPGGQTPTDRTGTVTVQADTRTISGYYKVNTGADTALTTIATVGFGTSEAAAKAGLTTSGYAKLSDGSYVPVTISWTFDSSYDGSAVGDKAVKGTVSGTFPGGQTPTDRIGTVTVQADTRTISGYYKVNTGADTTLTTIATVAFGTSEATAKAGLTTSGYAKLSDGSYVPVTISWTFDSSYDGSAVGDKAVKGTVSGTFPGGQTPTDRIGTVTVQADTRTISGYFKVNTGADTILTTIATVAFGTSEAAAKAGLTTSGYAKLSDGSYVPVTISWSFDSSYDGSASGDKAVKGTVSGTFPGGQMPIDRTGTVTVGADTRTIVGYYKDNTGPDTTLATTTSVPYGTVEATAKVGLTTSGYAKLSDGSYVPVTISWTFDSSYDGSVAGDKVVKGTVSGTFPGGQIATDRPGTVTVGADTRTIIGYYKGNIGPDTTLTTTTSVPYGTIEATAKAGLTSTGYAKLSDNSYVAVTINWAFSTAYNGSVAGDKAVIGTITGNFLGGQIPMDRTGIITVQAYIPTSNSAPIPIPAPSPTPKVEQITVEVKQGNTNNTVSQITIERATDANGDKSDKVTYQEEKAIETIDKLKGEGKDVARILIPDEKDEISETIVNIPSATLSALAEGEINLQIDTEEAKIDISKETLKRVNDGFEEVLYFNLVPIKEEKQKEEVAKRAKFEVGVLNGNSQSGISMVSVPVTIETNMPSTKVDITLPLTGIDIPTNPIEREAFLNQLAVYIEHSDGEKELVKGEIVQYKEGVLGIKFNITKFSIFTIVKTDTANKSTSCDIMKVNSLTEASIIGKKISATVANSTTSLTVKATVSDNASWKIFTDKACKKEIMKHKLNLKPGSNKVYIKVTAEDGTISKVYTLTITRQKAPVKVIVVATKYDFTDAFASGVLAGQLGVDILRTGNSELDAKEMLRDIKKNYSHEDKIYIIGLGQAINGNLKKLLTKEGFANVISIGGENKYETAKLIAENVKLPEKTKVVLVNGEIEPRNAKNIQKECAELGYPILFVKTNSLTTYSIEALKKINPTQIYIVGDKSQISSKVVNEIKKELGLENSDIIRINANIDIK